MSQSVPSANVAITPQTSGILRLFGWTGFWLQLVITVVASIFLSLAVLSRNIDNQVQSSGTGIGIGLAVCSILTLGFSAYLSFRYTRFAKRLNIPNAVMQPSRGDILQVVYLALGASIIGMLATLIGAEVSDSVLLARAMSQPQGSMIYDPDKTIRVLDILVVLVNNSLAVVHLLGNVTSLWLLRQFD